MSSSFLLRCWRKREADYGKGISPAGDRQDPVLDCRGNHFTIDGADTRTSTSAVSLVRWEDGWELGVHIADDVLRQIHSHWTRKRLVAFGILSHLIPMLPRNLLGSVL